MATMITSECINCGACEPECPNTAIYQGGVEWQALDGAMHPALSNDIFYIVPEKCTECVGFYDHEACAAVCPVDCCVPNPDIPEAEGVLLARARTIHPDKTIPDDAPSRFKKDGAGAAAPAAAAPAAAPKPAAAAPAAAAPAAAVPAATLAAPRPAVVRGRVEKPLAPAPPRAPRSFAGQLALDFDELASQLGPPRRRPRSFVARLALLALSLGQGFLGAAPAGSKRKLEAAVSDRRYFDASLATAANVFLNFVIYPVLVCGLAQAAGRADVFTQGMAKWVFLGMTIASFEAAFRLRESFFRGQPLANTPLRAALYGPLVAPVVAILSRVVGLGGATSGVGFDGFYAGREHFDEKLERDRRYGSIFHLEERQDAYVLRLEFPRRVPPSSLADELGLPMDMPDYDYDLALADGGLVVHGKVTDPKVRRITGVAPAFPSEFTTRVPLDAPVAGFSHRYHDKMLEVILPKAAR
jgi:ferredoxin